MQPEEKRDSTALRKALAATVVLAPLDLPCQWAQPVPCQNPGLLRTQDGALTLCPDHYNRYHV